MSEQITLTDWCPDSVPKAWEYDEDNGSVLCRCPVCGGRMVIGCYAYWNPYHFCPYCGRKLNEGRFVDRMVQIYDNMNRETMERVRREG